MSEWLLIIGMALVTFLPRYLPFGLAGKVEIPPLVASALSFVPIAVLTVIIVQTAFFRQGELSLSFNNHYLVASIIAFIAALLTKQLYWTIFLGLLSFIAISYFSRPF